MSLIRWFATRAIPLAILGGAAAYLAAIQQTAPASEKLILIGLMLAILASLLSGKAHAHPAYAPGMLCLVSGILFYESWQQNGLHAELTVVAGAVLAILFLTSIPRFATLLDP